MSSRRTAAASASAATVSASPRKGRSTAADTNAKPKAEKRDTFEFNGEQEEEEDVDMTKRKGRSAASPRKGRSGKQSKAAVEEEEEEKEVAVEEDEDAEEEEPAEQKSSSRSKRASTNVAAASDSLMSDEDVGAPIPRRLSSAGVSVSQLSKEEQAKLLDPRTIREAFASKELLVKTLKKLSLLLGGLNQRTLTEKGRELAATLLDKQIVKHKSQEVRANAACCMADLFRIFAPTAPFDANERLQVFRLFAEQLSNLSTPSHPDANRCFFLLEAMLTTKCACILTNEDADADKALHELFQLFFALAKHDLSMTVQQHILGVMSDVLLACEPVPTILLDEILVHLTTDSMMENQGGSTLAINLINKNRDSLERPIFTFLHELLVKKADVSDVDTSIVNHDDHLSILAQLFIHCNSVMRQFQHDAQHLLAVADEKEREDYTDLFCKVFSSSTVSSANPSIMQSNQSLFDTLLNRFRDTKTDIRVIMAKAAGTLLIRQSEDEKNKLALQDLLNDTSMDREDSVRKAIIESVREAGLFDPLLTSVKGTMVISQRLMDKKLSVRQTALNCLADLFAAHCASYWREGVGSPASANPYRGIPKKLVSVSTLDKHTAVNVDVLLDETILGKDISIEQRTRCLIGLYAALVDKKNDEKVSILAEVSSDPNADRAPEKNARRIFADHILGMKVRTHHSIHELLAIHQSMQQHKSNNAVSNPEIARLERVKEAQLIQLARTLIFDGDATEADMAALLQVIIFESKDKNIHKYLRVLSSPLTQYEQIRLAQSQLIACVRSISASTKHKRLTAATVASRLATMMSMAILPIESVEMIYREMEATMNTPNRVSLFKTAQELLLLIAEKFPLLLTHPRTMDALFSHFNFAQKQDDAIIQYNALQILALIKEQKSVAALSKKTSAAFLNHLKDIALTGSVEHATLAVDCIQNLWGRAPKPISNTVTNEEDSKEESKADEMEETEGDRVLLSLVEHHTDALSMDSESLPTSIACLAQITLINYPLVATRAADQRRTALLFVMNELFPTEDIVTHHESRTQAIKFVQAYLCGFGRAGGQVGGELDDKLIAPRSWLSALIKIVKLDGRFPAHSMTSAQQLARVKKEEESEDDTHAEARYEFLLATALALLEICTVNVYHRHLLHPSNEALQQYTTRKENGTLQSPSKTANGVAGRHPFHFLSIAYLARHPKPQVSKRFIERVLKLMNESRLPYAMYATILVLAANHRSQSLIDKLRLSMLVLTRRQRQNARRLEEQHYAKQQQEKEKEAATGNKGSKKKKKGDEDEEETNTPRRTNRVANGAMPEYAIADLVYVLSYDPRLNAKQKEDVRKRDLDEMVVYIDFFLDILFKDGPEEGGGHFDLVLNILTDLRRSEDIRDPNNEKIYKLAELAILSVQQRMAHERWSNVKYDQIQLSRLFWFPRLTKTKDKYLPSDYRLPSKATTAHEKAMVMEDEEPAAAEQPLSPTRKRKSAGGRKKAEEEDAEEEDEDEEEAPTRTKKASKPKKELKEEAAPTRGRLSRGAKEAAVKYTEQSDDEMETGEYVVVKSPARSRGRSKKQSDEEEEEEEKQPASGEDDEDVDMESAPKLPLKDGRGRPKKQQPVAEEEEEEQQPAKKKQKQGNQMSMKDFMSIKASPRK